MKVGAKITKLAFNHLWISARESKEESTVYVNEDYVNLDVKTENDSVKIVRGKSRGEIASKAVFFRDTNPSYKFSALKYRTYKVNILYLLACT
jgi:hypothetical protein